MRILRAWIFTVALVAIAGCGGGDGTAPSSSGSGGGASSTGSTSGAGGTGGVTAFDPPGPKDPDAVVRAAIFLGSCIPELGINLILNEIYTEKWSVPYAKAFHDTTECFATKANGCISLEECIGMTIDTTGPCARSCNGPTAVGCNNIFKFSVDCAKLGLACAVTGNFCIQDPPPPACDPNTYMGSCTDGMPHNCLSSSQGELTGPVCADHGVVCGDGPTGDKLCIGAGPACTAQPYALEAVEFDQGIACDGTRLRTCVNGFEHLLDCSTLASGFACQTATSVSFCGFAIECDPGAASAPACDGDQVVVCNGGRIDKIDCNALGFTGCDPMLGVCTPNAFSQP